MAIIKRADIVGVHSKDGMLRCMECLADDKYENLKQTDIITRDILESDDDNLYFCDGCNQKL
jgi:hypothetical protein